MSINDGGLTGPGSASGFRPSAELVAVSRRMLRHLPPKTVAQYAARRDLTRMQPSAPAAAVEFAAKARTVSLARTMPEPNRDAGGPDSVLSRRVDDVLRMWAFDTKRASPCVERKKAWLGIIAALNARRLILECRTPDGWKAAVDEFARTWLAIRRPDEEWLEAVSTALLGDWVDLLDDHAVDDAGDLGLKAIKKEAAVVHRQLQPLSARKVNGRRVLSLDHPVPGGGTLVDLLAGREASEEPSKLWEPETDRAAIVFGQLSPVEQQVARAWACSARSSWAEAADLAGVTETDADGVRRKLRRLGLRHEERTSSARSTRGWPLQGTAGSRT